MAINNEASKESPDQEKLQSLNQELRHAYAQVMMNKNMTAYNEAKQEMDKLIMRVNAIIEQSVDGEDPETADYVEHSCGGECGSCAGCH